MYNAVYHAVDHAVYSAEEKPPPQNKNASVGEGVVCGCFIGKMTLATFFPGVLQLFLLAIPGRAKKTTVFIKYDPKSPRIKFFGLPGPTS